MEVVRVALLVAVALTPLGGLVSALLARRYTRRIAELTGQQVHRARRRSAVGGSLDATRPVDPLPPAAVFAFGRARRNLRVYVAAAGAFAVAAALVLLMSQGADLGANYQSVTLVTLLSLSFGLPMLVVAPLVHEARRWFRVSAWAVWVSAVLLLVVFGQGSQRQSPLLLLALVVAPIALPPLAITLTATRRAARGVAWLLAPAATTIVFVVVCSGGWGLTDETGAVVRTMIVGAVVGGGFAAVVWAAYRTRRSNDQGVAMALVWFYETVVLLYFTLFSHADAWLLWCLVPLLLFLVVVGVAFGITSHDHPGPPINLLLLRSFARRRDNVRLLRDLELYWRYLGCILLIGGTDLAAETLEPDELVDWATGRLGRRVIATPDQALPRLDGLSFAPDADGRHRVHDLVCADVAWHDSCHAAMRAVEVVIVDVRGFHGPTSGLAWELTTLVEMPPATIVAVVSTDGERKALEPLERAGHRVTVLPTGVRRPNARDLLLTVAAALPAPSRRGTS